MCSSEALWDFWKGDISISVTTTLICLEALFVAFLAYYLNLTWAQAGGAFTGSFDATSDFWAASAFYVQNCTVSRARVALF